MRRVAAAGLTVAFVVALARTGASGWWVMAVVLVILAGCLFWTEA